MARRRGVDPSVPCKAWTKSCRRWHTQHRSVASRGGSSSGGRGGSIPPTSPSGNRCGSVPPGPVGCTWCSTGSGLVTRDGRAHTIVRPGDREAARRRAGDILARRAHPDHGVEHSAGGRRELGLAMPVATAAARAPRRPAHRYSARGWSARSCPSTKTRQASFRTVADMATTKSDLAIEVTGLRMAYGETEVVHGIDLAVRRGEVFTVLGPNGAGKTTTLEILEGFRRRTGGLVQVLGTDPWKARHAGASASASSCSRARPSRSSPWSRPSTSTRASTITRSRRRRSSS